MVDRASLVKNVDISPINVVLRDIDGTLVDSNDAHASAWVDALREANYRASFVQVRRLIGKGGDKLLPEVTGLAEDSPEGTAIIRRRGMIFRDRYFSSIRPFPCALERLERLPEEPTCSSMRPRRRTRSTPSRTLTSSRQRFARRDVPPTSLFFSAILRMTSRRRKRLVLVPWACAPGVGRPSSCGELSTSTTTPPTSSRTTTVRLSGFEDRVSPPGAARRRLTSVDAERLVRRERHLRDAEPLRRARAARAETMET